VKKFNKQHQHRKTYLHKIKSDISIMGFSVSQLIGS